MKPEIVENLMACHRAGAKNDPRVEKAVRRATKNDELCRKLDQQQIFDTRILQVVKFIEPPEDLRQRLQREPRNGSAADGVHLSHPAILSAIFGVLFIIGFLVWLQMQSAKAFPGRDSVERMIEITRHMSGVELEPTSLPAGQLADVFYMRGFEGFTLPAELNTLPAVGCRVFKQGGRPVAQLAIEEHHALVFVFRASDFGVQLPEPRQWRILTQESWVAAVRPEGELCTMIAFRGEEPEMKQFLKALKL